MLKLKYLVPLLVAMICAIFLSIPEVSGSGSAYGSSMGPTMTSRGQLYGHEINNFPLQGQAMRTISGVNWSWGFDTGCASYFGGIAPGSVCIVQNPQPSNMQVWLCKESSSCIEITGQRTGGTGTWNGHTFWNYPPKFQLFFSPNGSGVLTPTAKGKVNGISISFN